MTGRMSTPSARAVTDVVVLLAPDELRRALERDARTGLTASPKWLAPKYFYDDAGSALFEDITRLPEYYPTRAEHALLTVVLATRPGRGRLAFLQAEQGPEGHGRSPTYRNRRRSRRSWPR